MEQPKLQCSLLPERGLKAAAESKDCDLENKDELTNSTQKSLFLSPSNVLCSSKVTFLSLLSNLQLGTFENSPENSY